MNAGRLIAAIDIGSVAIKGVVLDRDGARRATAQRLIRGRLQPCLLDLLEELSQPPADEALLLGAVTGARAGSYAALFGVREVSPIVAACQGVWRLAPEAGAALELGGEHTRFLRFGPAMAAGQRPLEECSQNAACSAGTGTFLEQEAHRFGLGIEEFGRQAAAARRTVRVAGRCAVFAKTDLVHKHQNGIPLDDLAYGLCLAIAQSVAAELAGPVPFIRPLALVGGVAANPGMRRAVREAFGLGESDLLVPEAHAFTNAIGAASAALEGPGVPLRHCIHRLRTRAPPPIEGKRLAPLLAEPEAHPAQRPAPVPRRPGDASGGTLGIDIGSTSTNLAWVACDGEVRDARSLPTRGEPLSAVASLLEQFEADHGALRPAATGVTGSGRRLVAELIGADLAVNEITAHAAACSRFFPGADTVFDIGGQDAKYIRLAAGSVVGFQMNKVCSAGTGSFLEEMATLLGLDIVDQFGREALQSREPIDLGERCTVFMGSEIARRLQEGARRQDLAAGLAYAVVRNYLSRVVGRHPVGAQVVFQGGVAANRAVVAALARVLGRPVTVHPYSDTAGAIGVAMLAGRQSSGRSRFRGMDGLKLSEIRTRSFSCPQCGNRCSVHVTQGPERRRYFAGGLCDRYDGAGARADPATVDLFAERETLLTRAVVEAPVTTAGVVGLPRALLFQDQLPFWATFLNALGVPYVLSPPTTRQVVERGGAVVRHGSCLPLRVGYGHVAELIAAGVKRILVPSVASQSDGTVPERLSHVCPTVQGWPYTTRALFDSGVDVLAPRVRLSLPHLAERDMVGFGSTLGAAPKTAREAFAAANAAQREFRNAMLRRGDAILATRRERLLAVLFSRPYTVADPQVLLRLRRVLADVGITGVPLEMVRDEPAASRELNGMYWYSGKRLLQAARAVRQLGDIAVINVSNFGCGPDSFLRHMLRRELGDVPTLELEVDEHSEFNGIHTRVEAFRWAMGTPRPATPASPDPPDASAGRELRGRCLYIPRMSDHAEAIAAAFRSCGVSAEVLPPPDAESVALGRAVLDGTECLPCAFVLGDMLRQLQQPRRDGPEPAFFMIAGDGPCRLGQYPWLQRAVLDEQGHAGVPIFNASQDPEFYEKFGMVPADFQRRAWEGMVATDLLFRKWHECRIRTGDRAALDAIYHQELRRLGETIERGAALPDTLGRSFDRLDALVSRGAPEPLRIGLLGENYVRCNASANARIADTLEELGVEVWYPSLCEWVLYTNWTARLHCRYERQPRRLLLLHAIEGLQRLELARFGRAVRGRLANAGYPPVRRLLRLAAPYVPDTFEGETVVGIGRTIDLFRRGVAGVIHVAPFGCMVGAIVEAIARRVSTDLGGFPILHLQYDGREGEHARGVLEGFVLRARAWQAARRSRGRGSLRLEGAVP